MERFEEVKVQDEIDEKMGFWRFESGLAGGEKKVGWLVNMHQVSFLSSFRLNRAKVKKLTEGFGCRR